MRKVHLISISEPLILDLAIAIRDKGYEVTVSGEGLTDTILDILRQNKCKCYGEGWFPEKLNRDINFVVLGATVASNNPELQKAQELGLLIQSVPEFVYQRTKQKTRVVIAGSYGKNSIINMIAFALTSQKLKFDYALTGHCQVLSNHFKMDYEARIALIEGDAEVTSNLEKRFQLEFYRPHIALLTTVEAPSSGITKKERVEIYKDFTGSIEREGKLIWFEGDPALKQLANGVREDITAIPYNEHEVVEEDGKLFLQTRYGLFPVWVPDPYFLRNLNAARLVCRQLGVKDADFYKAISEYSLSLHA